MFRIVISRHCGIVRFFRPTPGLVEFHFRSRGMRLRRRVCCTLCRTGSSRNRFLPHKKIFNGSGFIEKKRRGGRNPPPPVRASVKAITTDKPGYLSELISFDQPTRQLRSSAHRRLTVTRCRTNFGSRAFYHAAPAVWNGLPSAITSNLLTLDAFKRAVKTHFFEQSVHQ